MQPPLGVLGAGNSGVDAAGDLVNIVADVVSLRAQILDLLGGTGADLPALQKPYYERPLGQTALLGLFRQQPVLFGR